MPWVMSYATTRTKNTLAYVLELKLTLADWTSVVVCHGGGGGGGVISQGSITGASTVTVAPDALQR